MTNRTTEELRMSWAEACALRLTRHFLAGTAPLGGIPEAASALCGAHAQIMSGAEMSLGMRVPGTTRTDVQAALWKDRSLVKTYGPRGTVHLLAAEELPLWVGALSCVPRPPSALPHALLTDRQLTEVVDAIEAAVEDGELTVEELGDEVTGRTGPWAADLALPAFSGAWPRWRAALQTAANRGVICFGPNQGRKVTYTSPSRWVPGFRPMDSGIASAEILRRYLRAYGPATPQQFAQWLGAPRRWSATLFEAITDELIPVDLEGVKAWTTAPAVSVAPSSHRGLRLLPYFDPYVIGCHPRDAVYPGLAAARALSGGQAGNVPVVLIDGVVAGVWHQRRSGRRLDIRVEPFAPLSAGRRAELTAQAERIGEILEGTPALTIGVVDAGKHL
uniref:Winged helix DNA-binding domain-containing protein n=1 Tax=Streptomyces sp. NBC_01401 TaxID=2903854 RepID=A0AAU3GS99_9ACTN